MVPSLQHQARLACVMGHGNETEIIHKFCPLSGKQRNRHLKIFRRDVSRDCADLVNDTDLQTKDA